MRPAYTLDELLPHAEPMILLDDVISSGNDTLCAGVRITEASLFYEPNRGVPTYVGIEYIAQAVAALGGLRARTRGGEVGIGYLLGARRYMAHAAYFPLGSLLAISVSSEFETDDLAAYQGDIRDSDGRRLVDATINIYSGKIETDP